MNASLSVLPQHIDFLGFRPDGYSLSGGHILTAYKSSGKWRLWTDEGRGGKEGRQARALEKVNREEPAIRIHPTNQAALTNPFRAHMLCTEVSRFPVQ